MIKSFINKVCKPAVQLLITSTELIFEYLSRIISQKATICLQLSICKQKTFESILASEYYLWNQSF